MKFKKLILSASAAVASTGVLATVLTSCAKQDIEDKYKINLDNVGNFIDPKIFGSDRFGYQEAIQMALTRSSNWATFKQALADEIVFQWYKNRMADKKDDVNGKNTTFKINYDEFEKAVNDDYDKSIQDLKTKYGANYGFYLQNELLSPLGGTEATYKHAKMVDKIKEDFVKRVFANDYFSVKDESEQTPRSVFPAMFTKANKTGIQLNDLNNNQNWNKIGFFARSERSFSITGADDADSYGKITDQMKKEMSRHNDGDYATIQNFVFDKWFETDKPFFSNAALFNYSNPKYVADAKLENIYDFTYTGVTKAESPNESFPFFGGYKEENKGTRAFDDWYNRLVDGEFTNTYYEGSDEKYNGTISLAKNVTEDSQTCLLVSGLNMIGGSTDTLFMPYALASSDLYNRLIYGKSTIQNERTKLFTDGNTLPTLDNYTLLKNFFYTSTTDADVPLEGEAEGVLYTKKVKTYIDLNKIYGGLTNEGQLNEEYHCPLFKNANDDLSNYFWNGTDGKHGVRYITNSFYIELPVSAEADAKKIGWVLELNEKGVHAQSIDGWNYVQEKREAEQETAKQVQVAKAALQDVLKYRLMYKKAGFDNDGKISGDIFGDSGKLKTFFSSNFADIILEMAMSDDENLNIFRKIECYNNDNIDPENDHDNLFLPKLYFDESLGSAPKQLIDYLKLINTFDHAKKEIDIVTSANDKIYAYRSKQIESAKKFADGKPGADVYNNGLLAPLPYKFSNKDSQTHNYDLTSIIVSDLDVEELTLTDYLDGIIDEIRNSVFANTRATPDGLTGFCPQIKEAKKVQSNRYWYRSAIIDKVMYNFMGDKSQLANGIKIESFKKYTDMNHFSDWTKQMQSDQYTNAHSSIYARSKLFTDSKNLASYCTLSDFGTGEDYNTSNYYSILNNALLNKFSKATTLEGPCCDESYQQYLFNATFAYLVNNNFEHFYEALNKMINEDEVANIGYVAKYDLDHVGSESEYRQQLTSLDSMTPYEFNPDIENIFDSTGYAGNNNPSYNFNEVIKSTDSYWNVIKKGNIDLAGFTGIQTASNNTLDSSSGLQKAAFNQLAGSTVGSLDLNTSEVIDDKYAQNQGCWYQFAGQYDTKGNEYTFKGTIKGKVSEGVTKEFTIDDFAQYPLVKKLVSKIVERRTQDDLRELAKKLDESYLGSSEFGKFATTPFETIDDMKAAMLDCLPSAKRIDANTLYIPFQRMKNVELHSFGISNTKYVFEDKTKNVGYRYIMSQINKDDISALTPVDGENVHIMTPIWISDATTGEGHWESRLESPVSADEFWAIFMQVLNKSSVQELAIADVVKQVFGDDKLVVYDAQLYNCFDSIWIKDWVKKPMGA